MKLTTDVPLLFLSAVDNNSIFAYFYVTSMDFKKKIMAFFYGLDSTASRLEELRGSSLLFTTKFPEIYGTHFTDLGRMKG